MIRGRVGKYEVKEEPYTGRPFTYWDFSVIESYSDDKLRGNIQIRQPGGEIDGVGYYVAATAKFRDGEEVVLMLRETKESAKEVIGLASGKYTVMKDEEGNEFLQNGLGFPLRDSTGNLIGPKQFGDLVDRVLSRDTSEDDLKIRVHPMHTAGSFHPPQGGGFPSFVKKPKPDEKIARTPAKIAKQSDNTTQKPVEPTTVDPDREIASESSLSWLQAILIMAGFLTIILISYLVLRPKE